MTKTGIPTRDFTDAGTGEAFATGEAAEIEAGAHANYLAAGLIVEPDVDEAHADADAA